MHRTEVTALVNVRCEVSRHWQQDVWVVLIEAQSGESVVANLIATYDCRYWSAQAVEAIADVTRATLEAAYEM